MPDIDWKAKFENERVERLKAEARIRELRDANSEAEQRAENAEKQLTEVRKMLYSLSV
ncbi:hypothetical protein N9L18_00450 [Candidatus Pacebacteria bacterium]|nr:hypothetical protein [Candidatus Paceibacterota bacterium]